MAKIYDALKSLIEESNVSIRRKIWRKNVVGCVVSSEFCKLFISKESGIPDLPMQLSQEDIFADDWEVIRETNSIPKR